MAEAVLEVREVSRAYGALRATDDVSLDLRAGEIHAVIGPNGAGKSTLIGQIAGWVPCDSGSVHLAGEDVTRCSVAVRARRGLGRSFQVSVWAEPAPHSAITHRRFPNSPLSIRARILW